MENLKKIEEVNPKLAKFLEECSKQDGDRIIFEEQDATTLAVNITNFLETN